MAILERMNESANPRMINTGAIAVSSNATNWAVIVVPIFAPKMIPTLFLNESTPALTRLTAITEVAELDWITAVTKAPISMPITGIFVALARNLRNLSPEIFSISAEKFSNPKMKRMMAVNPAIIMWICSIVSLHPRVLRPSVVFSDNHDYPQLMWFVAKGL